MASVTGITAARAAIIEGNSVVSGSFNPANGHLSLTQFDGTVIDAGQIYDVTALPTHATAETAARTAAILVETNARIADVDAEEAARIAAITAITKPAPLNLSDGTNFTFTNTTASATLGGVASLEGTIVVPPTGRLRVAVFATLRASAGGASSQGPYVGYELRQTNVSGTVLVATDVQRAALNENLLAVAASSATVVTGLTPGSTVFARMMHWVDTGAQGGCRVRRLLVEGC